MSEAKLERVRKRFREETPYWATHVAKIVTKRGDLVPLVPKAGQLELDRRLEEQRLAGKPQRAIVLKARQVGISTWTQAKLIHRCTQRSRYNAVVVAHDRETGAKLYRMGETIYANLPDDPKLGLKPDVGQYRRSRFLHFANGGKEAWAKGNAWPDSSYFVDTAGEFQAGRGGTYRAVHASEVAFWQDIQAKLTALRNAVPRDPETLFLIESTANGYNEFKDEWDRAEAGDSDYIPFFWPWWKEDEYQLAFANETERELFVIGDGPYGEEEPKLVEEFGLSKEQLHWRRVVIANECGGRVDIFHQEYPSSPEEAFLATGQRVFDPYLVRGVLFGCDETDPKSPTLEHPGPVRGKLIGQDKIARRARVGTVMVPQKPVWVPREPGSIAPIEWRLWLPETELEERTRDYVIGCDVSGGELNETTEPAYHAISVIDHESKEQVAEYASRTDPDLLAVELLLAALFFNRAWVAVERTGGWGLPVVRRLFLDFGYPFVYKSRKKDSPSEKQDHRLGWDTNRQTKPILEAGTAELLREGTHGIKSRALAMEMTTYVRDDAGRTGPEPGKYSDRLIAYMIAQQVSRELPVKHNRTGGSGVIRTYRQKDPVTG